MADRRLRPGRPGPQPRPGVPRRLGVPRRHGRRCRTTTSRSPATPSAAAEDQRASTSPLVGNDTVRVQTERLDRRPRARTCAPTSPRPSASPRPRSARTFIGPSWGASSASRRCGPCVIFVVARRARHDACTSATGRWPLPRSSRSCTTCSSPSASTPSAVRGVAGDDDRLPHRPRLLPLRHRRGLRQGPREHQRGIRQRAPHFAQAANLAVNQTHGPLDQHHGRRRSCRSARCSSSAPSCSARACCSTSRWCCSSASSSARTPRSSSRPRCSSRCAATTRRSSSSTSGPPGTRPARPRTRRHAGAEHEARSTTGRARRVASSARAAPVAAEGEGCDAHRSGRAQVGPADSVRAAQPAAAHAEVQALNGGRPGGRAPRRRPEGRLHSRHGGGHHDGRGRTPHSRRCPRVRGPRRPRPRRAQPPRPRTPSSSRCSRWCRSTHPKADLDARRARVRRGGAGHEGQKRKLAATPTSPTRWR